MKQKKALNSSKYYTVGVVENNNQFQVVDTYQLKRVNQYKTNWQKVNARVVARKLNNGKILVN